MITMTMMTAGMEMMVTLGRPRKKEKKTVFDYVTLPHVGIKHSSAGKPGDGRIEDWFRWTTRSGWPREEDHGWLVSDLRDVYP